MDFCCPSAWSLLSAYMEYELSVVKRWSPRPLFEPRIFWSLAKPTRAMSLIGTRFHFGSGSRSSLGVTTIVRHGPRRVTHQQDEYHEQLENEGRC